MFDSRKNERGDLIVEVLIQAPDVRDERVRNLLKQLGALDAVRIFLEALRHWT